MPTSEYQKNPNLQTTPSEYANSNIDSNDIQYAKMDELPNEYQKNTNFRDIPINEYANTKNFHKTNTNLIQTLIKSKN